MIQAGTSVTAAFKADPSEEEIDYLIAHFLHQADAQVKQHYKADFKATDPNLRAFLGQSLGRPPVIDKVANMIGAEIPVAIVYGAQERLVQYDYLKKTVLPFWHNQIFRIDNAGHCVELDQPVALSGLLQAFAHDCFGR